MGGGGVYPRVYPGVLYVVKTNKNKSKNNKFRYELIKNTLETNISNNLSSIKTVIVTVTLAYYRQDERINSYNNSAILCRFCVCDYSNESRKLGGGGLYPGVISAGGFISGGYMGGLISGGAYIRGVAHSCAYKRGTYNRDFYNAMYHW